MKFGREELFREEMLSTIFFETNTAISSIFSACTIMCDGLDSEKDRETVYAINIISDMCMQFARGTKMLKFMESIPEKMEFQAQTFSCTNFLHEFIKRCHDILGDKVHITLVEEMENMITVNKELMEYAMLCFLRTKVMNGVKDITICVENKNGKVIIKMLAECNKKEKYTPFFFSESGKIYAEMISKILPQLTCAECKFEDSEFSIIVRDETLDGKITFRQPPVLVRSNNFTQYNMMLDDISEYRFFV